MKPGGVARRNRPLLVKRLLYFEVSKRIQDLIPLSPHHRRYVPKNVPSLDPCIEAYREVRID